MPKQAMQTQSASKVQAAGGKKTSSDVLVQIAQEVETLSQKKAFELIDELIRQRGETHFKLGGAFAVIIDKSKAPGNEEWLAGYGSFKELVENRFKFSYQKAWNLITIYKNLVAQQIPGTIVGEIGWSKVFVLAKVLTAKNAASWVERVEKENLTVEQLKVLARGGDPSSKPMTIPIDNPDHKDAIRQALRKGKKEANTKYNAVALHNICQGYLSNAVTMDVVGQQHEKPKQKTKLKEYWLALLGKEFEEMRGVLGGDDAPALVLSTFQDHWPAIKVIVETP
jgi:hypothetical protein